MKQKAKRDMPDFMLLFFGYIRTIHAKSGVALAAMAAGLRRKIVLPEIFCFRKVAL